MRVAGYIFGTMLILLGMVFCAAAASTGLWQRWVLGGILGGAGLAVLAVSRLRPEAITVEHRLENPGDTRLEELTCKRCGGNLDSQSVSYKAGAIFVACPYCNAEYQLEEEPKW